MKFLQIGKANTITYVRNSPDVTVTNAKVYDSSNASLIETLVATNDATSVAMTSSASVGDYQLQMASAVIAGKPYVLRHNPATSGPDVDIEVYSISASHLASIKYPLSCDIASGTLVKGVNVTASYTPTTTLSTRSVRIDWTISDGTVVSEEYFLSLKTVDCPIKSADVVRKWNVLRDNAPEWQRRTGVDWQPQVDEAWDKLSDLLAEHNICLHNVRSVSFLKEPLWALIGYELTSMGYDPGGSENRDDMMRMFKRDIDNNVRHLLSAPVWIDIDETGIADDSNSTPKYWTMGYARQDSGLR